VVAADPAALVAAARAARATLQPEGAAIRATGLAALPPELAAALRRQREEVHLWLYAEAAALPDPADEEAWARYLPPETPSIPPPPPSDPPHRHDQGNSRASGGFRAATGNGAWRYEIGRKPAENLGCGGVAVSNPPLGGERGERGGDPSGDDEVLF
jgi:hypothetical protein